MTDIDRILCAATARLLQASGVVAAWGLALSILALAVLAFAGPSLSMWSWTGFGAVALAGVLERYLAFRLYFDAGLFKDLSMATSAPLEALDTALQRLGLRPTSGLLQPRALEDRLAGARQLLQRHVITVACQSGLFLLALLTLNLR